MSIALLDACLYPDELLEQELALGSACRWWVVYTKARQEKSLARDLLSREVPFYLPLVPKRVMYRGRKVVTHLPLFTGYVFLCANEEQRIKCLTTNRALQLFPVPDPEELQNDLRKIQRLIASDAPLTVESRLAPGRRVRIRSGPMLGMEGIIDSRRGTDYLIVVVHFLQQGVAVEVDDFQVEPID